MKLIFNFDLDLINELPRKLQERYLKYFSGDEDWNIRRNVAEHPNTPTHILEKLIDDESEFVRYYVASNPNTTSHILEKLSRDESWYVRNNATQNLEKRR